MLKGWAVTLVAGVFVLAVKDSNPLYFLIAYIPVALFWFLDSYYLQLERKFHVLYKRVGSCEKPDLTFCIKTPDPCSKDKTMHCQSLFSITEVWFYVPVALLIAFVVVRANI